MIDVESLEEHFVELHRAVNDMDSFLYETDVYNPEEFYKVVGGMEVAALVDVNKREN